MKKKITRSDIVLNQINFRIIFISNNACRALCGGLLTAMCVTMSEALWSFRILAVIRLLHLSGFQTGLKTFNRPLLRSSSAFFCALNWKCSPELSFKSTRHVKMFQVPPSMKICANGVCNLVHHSGYNFQRLAV